MKKARALLIVTLSFWSVASAGETTASCPPPHVVDIANPVHPILGCSNYFSNVRPAAAPENSFMCPVSKNLRFLPPTYPAGGMFVSYIPGHPAGVIPDTYPPEGLQAAPDNSAFITTLVTEAQTASPNTQVNIVVSESNRAAAEAALAGVLNRPNVRLMVIPARMEPDTEGSGQVNAQGVSMWMQDIMELGVRDGNPALVDLPVEPERGGDTPRVIADQCSGTQGGVARAEAAGAYVNPAKPGAAPGDTGPMSRLFQRTGTDHMSCVGDFIGIGVAVDDAAARAETEARWPACAEASVRVRIGDFRPITDPGADTAGTEMISPFEAAARMGRQPSSQAGVSHELDLGIVPTTCCNDPRHRRPLYSSADFGGNLEGFPLDVVAVGENMHGPLKDYLRQEGNNVVEIEAARYLAVGHVDEIFSVVPAPGTAPCNFTLLRASPAEALTVMRAQPPATRFGDNNVECRPKVTGPANARRVSCQGPRTVRQWLNDADAIDFNNRMEATIRRDTDRLLAQFRQRCPNVQAVAVPTLYSTKDFMPGDTPDTIGMAAGESVLPGMVNGLVLNNTLIAPDPHFNPFKDRFMANLRAGGVTPQAGQTGGPFSVNPRFVDDTVYHNGVGEIHCGTNVIRSCTPLVEPDGYSQYLQQQQTAPAAQ